MCQIIAWKKEINKKLKNLAVALKFFYFLAVLSLNSSLFDQIFLPVLFAYRSMNK